MIDPTLFHKAWDCFEAIQVAKSDSGVVLAIYEHLKQVADAHNFAQAFEAGVRDAQREHHPCINAHPESAEYVSPFGSEPVTPIHFDIDEGHGPSVIYVDPHGTATTYLPDPEVVRAVSALEDKSIDVC